VPARENGVRAITNVRTNDGIADCDTRERNYIFGLKGGLRICLPYEQERWSEKREAAIKNHARSSERAEYQYQFIFRKSASPIQTLFAHAGLRRRMSVSVVFFAKSILANRHRRCRTTICEGAIVSATRYSCPTLHNVLKRRAQQALCGSLMIALAAPVNRTNVTGICPDHYVFGLSQRATWKAIQTLRVFVGLCD
jgi:hypothetical protein